MNEFAPLNRSSSKWRRYPADVLPMHVAEMDFEVDENIRRELISMIERSDLGYLGPIPEVARAFAGFANSRWNWKINQGGLKIATDVGVAAVEILRAVAKPGERVLINTPVYSSFHGWIKEVGCVSEDAPLIRSGQKWLLDVPAIAKAFESGVKIYLMCSPHNPVGAIHDRNDLLEIARLAREHDVLVISDEIHAPLSWETFTPYLSLGEDAEQTGVTITSSSKAWNTAGLKAGFLITQSEKVEKKLAAVPEAIHWRSSLLGAWAMSVSFTAGVGWLDRTVEQIRQNSEFLQRELSRELPEALVAETTATYLAWIDLGAYKVSAPAEKILREGKVALVPGPDHGGPQYDQFVRFNFATTQERITEAVRRIALSLKS